MNYYNINRPEIALITNHGYAGPVIPFGGATDTGGQNYYVNTLALKLEKFGYKITIFTRGGFPHFESNRIRNKPEYLSEYVRYIYVPGGGNTFIQKENIAIALDEELEWIYDFINKESKINNCEPWEIYEFINSHYWDAAILGVSLVERWKNDMVSKSLRRLLEGIISDNELEELHKDRHWLSIGEIPSLYLGWLLINQMGARDLPVIQQLRAAASCWANAKGFSVNDENYLVDSTEEALLRLETTFEPELKRLVASANLGQAILTLSPVSDNQLKRNLDRIDRHIWTPHSLENIKNYNFRSKSTGVRRKLKFCERRSHERMISKHTRLFISTSTKISEYLWAYYQVPIEQTFYFPPCVDEEIFRTYKEHELTTTYRYLSKISGVSVKKLKAGRIIFETSRMDKTKRKDLLIAAFAKFISHYDDVYLFIGGGPENELFEILKNQIQYTEVLEGKAFLTGPIPDKYIGPMFSLAHIYATASEMEGFGMCVSQAAAAGTAIVSSDVIPFSIYHIPEYVEMFPKGNLNAFSKAIQNLLNDDDKRIKNCQHIKEKAKVLNWENKIIEFLEFLKQKGIITTKNEKTQ